MAYQLGKNRPVIDDRTMSFATYVKPALPSPPVSVEYGAKVAGWPMYYNDQYGDCTCAAAGHMIQNWTANAAAEVTVPPPSVLSFYEHFVGTPPPPDQGCDMLSVLKYWRRAGIDGHKVLAFTSIDLQNQVQAQSACWLFGSIYIGVALPDFTVPPNVDPLTIPWVVPAGGPVGSAAPNQNNGHCIPAVSYDEENLYVVTWGEVKPMSWGFYNAYADESFAVISQDFIEANGLNPVGFDLTALKAELTQVTG
jgi:hypothetical protein